MQSVFGLHNKERFEVTCYALTPSDKSRWRGCIETEAEYFNTRSKKIITNVVASLEANTNRRFHWVEMVYFREWWGEQTADTQASVRALVAEKRLVFLTGGLCMNDEAL